MMGKTDRVFAPLPPVSLEELVPADHFYRHLERVLDLGFVRDLVRDAYADARRLAQRIEWHHTPKHGSWLNMVEIELAVLSDQCLDRRLPDLATVAAEVAAWEAARNAARATIDWRFTTAAARSKPHRLYPFRDPANPQ